MGKIVLQGSYSEHRRTICLVFQNYTNRLFNNPLENKTKTEKQPIFLLKLDQEDISS